MRQQQESSRLIVRGESSSSGSGSGKNSGNDNCYNNNSSDIEMMPYSNGNDDDNKQSGNMMSDGNQSSTAEDHTKFIVLGGLDGLLAAISIIFGATGAGYDWSVVVVLGAAIIFAGAFAIGIDEYLSCKAHHEFVQAERRRGKWEFKHDKAGRIEEMIQIFEMKGMNHDDAVSVVNKMAKYENFFISLMVTEGLGLQSPEDDDDNLVLEAFILFCSYVGFGCLPLLVLYAGHEQMSSENLCTSAGICVSVVLFLLGSAKGSFSSASWLYCATESLIFGLSCAVISYTVGVYLSSYIG